MEKLSIFLANVVNLIIQPLITLLFALALAYFVWGLAQFILNADSSEGRKKGQAALIWGVVGLFVMAAVLGILQVGLRTFGLNLP